MPAPESALVVLVPEAEALVKPFRDAHDPSAAVGVPAHVTILYPFKPPDEVDDAVVARVRQCLAAFAPFDVVLSTARRFPHVLYLAPEPDEELRQLTRTIWQRFPETPPYGGKHPDIMPHLTIAQIADETRLDRIETEFAEAARGRLPIRARATEIVLLENRSGRWEIRTRFRLGS